MRLLAYFSSRTVRLLVHLSRKALWGRKLGFLAVQRNIQSPPGVFVFLSSICVLRGIVFVQDRRAIFLSSAETDYAGSAEWFTAISRGPTTSMVWAKKETLQNCNESVMILFQTWGPICKGLLLATSSETFLTLMCAQNLINYAIWQDFYLFEQFNFVNVIPDQSKAIVNTNLLFFHHLFLINLQF